MNHKQAVAAAKDKVVSAMRDLQEAQAILASADGRSDRIMLAGPSLRAAVQSSSNAIRRLDGDYS